MLARIMCLRKSPSDEIFEPKVENVNETSESFFSTLPSDIIDYILDVTTLPSDIGTLCSLCLVSRTVYYIASAKLHRNVSLRSDEEFSLFRNTLTASPVHGLHIRSLALRWTSQNAERLSLEKLMYRLPNIRVLHLRPSSSTPRLPTTHPTLRCLYFGHSKNWDAAAILPDPCTYITHLAVGCSQSHLGIQLRSIRFEQLTHILFTNPWPGVLGEMYPTGLPAGLASGMDIFPSLPSSVQIFICWETGPPSKLPKLLRTHCEAFLRDLAIGKTDKRFIFAAPASWGCENQGDEGIERDWTKWVLVWNFAQRGPWFTGKWTIWDEAERLLEQRAAMRFGRQSRRM
ncbi:hypothetical protein DL96DRAFT_1613234 [Flagelloscypha sp. PMI_526]|nr:hypothetical protein DL96DRAFT_1613234 [Flagelloscypha sp. PMI_526]